MAVLKRFVGSALALGATGALLAPATPAAEKGASAGSDYPAGTSAPQPGSGAQADTAVSTDQDAAPVSDGRDGRPTTRGRGDRVVARAAASTSVTMSDYKFAPKTITVEVGDTVTWTNKGSEDHTATAKDGSFDTRLLQKGETGSATFEKAGTFAYICTPHPFMKGTVKVVANGSSAESGAGDDDAAGGGSPSAAEASATSGSGGNGSSTPTSGPGASSGNERLADTGSDALLVAASGLGLLLCGLGLRLLPRRA